MAFPRGVFRQQHGARTEPADRPVAHLSLGNPHSVVGVDDVAAVDLLAKLDVVLAG